MMPGSKEIEMPGLMMWKDRMELELNLEDVAKGFTFACRVLAHALADELPR